MKATELLERQHREVEGMFNQLQTGKVRPEQVEELCTALLAHSMIEEEIFYPAAKRFDREMVLESLEEHQLLSYAVKRLHACDPEGTSFAPKLKVACELVQNHVKEEEQELFPEAIESLGDEELSTLGSQMEARFDEIMAGGYEEAAAARRARRVQHNGHAKKTTKKSAHAHKMA
jgi:hemerythrin superfamily protein